MSYITHLGLTLTFDARLRCLCAAKQPDVDGKCYWLFPSEILTYSPVFWKHFSWLPLWDTSLGLSPTKLKPGPALSSGSGLSFSKPEPTQAQPKPGLWAQAGPGTSLPTTKDSVVKSLLHLQQTQYSRILSRSQLFRTMFVQRCSLLYDVLEYIHVYGI
jgi:hypothetical protein